MTMTLRQWLAVATLLLGSVVPGARAAEGVDAAALEQRIEAARRQLDEAARRLATLQRERWAHDMPGHEPDRPMLGVLLDPSAISDGVMLVGVTPNGGAERAGLRAGDRLVSVNGVSLDTPADDPPMKRLGQALSSIKAGDTVRVEYVRDGERRQAELQTQPRRMYMAEMLEKGLAPLAELGDLAQLKMLEGLERLDLSAAMERLKALEGPDSPFAPRGISRVPAGLELREVDAALGGYFGVERGVLVLAVPDESSGLRPGDILREVNGVTVTGADQAVELLAAAQTRVPATVVRQSKERTVSVDGAVLNARQDLQVKTGNRRIVIPVSPHPGDHGPPRKKD